MPTKIKPSELDRMMLPQYRKTLEKDFARTAKQNKFVEYVYIQKYKFGGKKSGLLLFVDAGDEQWSEAIEKAKAKGKKTATGKCKVLRGKSKEDGQKDTVSVVIKTAKGDMNKNKVAAVMNEELFDKDPLAEAYVEGEDSKIAKNAGDGQLKDAEAFTKDATLKEKTGKAAEKSKMTPFVEALDEFFKKIGSMDVLEKDIKERLSAVKDLHDEHDGKESYKKEVLPTAYDTVAYFEELNDQLEEIIEKGEFWLEKNGDLFAESLRSKEKKQRHKNKVKEVKGQLAQAHKIMRQLSNVQDKFLRKYLKDYSKDEGIHEGQLKTEREKFANLVEMYKSYSKLTEDKYQERLMFIDNILREIEKWYKGAYQPDKHKETLEKIAKKISKDRPAIQQGLLGTFDQEAFKEVVDAQKAFAAVKGKDLKAWTDRQKFLNTLVEKLTPLATTPDTQLLLGSKKEELREVNQKVEQLVANQAIAEVVSAAQRLGEVNADNLFAAFMDKYRGLNYKPEPSGKVLDGSSAANCQDLASAFIRVLVANDLRGASTEVLSTYYITTPVDGTWIDPNAPGNINIVGSEEKRYFFADHWVVKFNGKLYCPTSGRTGGDVKNTIWETPGKVKSGADPIPVGDYKFSSFIGKEAENNNLGYRLEK